MTKLKQIEDFLERGPMALVGVSRNQAKFGYKAFRELREKGMDIVPVNPYTDEIKGEKVYRDIKSLPDNIRGLIIMTRKDQTASIVRQARERGFRHLWIQQGSQTGEAMKEIEGSGINFVTGQCILMHFKPHGIHKFHGRLKKFFGLFPV